MVIVRTLVVAACVAMSAPLLAQDTTPVKAERGAETTKSLYAPDRDYLRERLELMRRSQVPDFDRTKTQNGWPSFVRAVSSSRGAVALAASGPALKKWIEDGGQGGSRSYQDLLDAAAGLCKDATPELIAEGREFLDRFNASSLAFELDALTNEIAFVEGVTLESPAMFHLLPHLGDARQTARLCAARMSYASIMGDEKALVRAYANLLSLARACSYEGYLISTLVSNAIDSLAYQRLIEVLAAKPVSASTLRELLRASGASPRADWATAIDGERLCSLDTLNWVYTTSSFEMLDAMQSGNGNRIAGGIVGKLKSWAYAPREEALGKLDSFFLTAKQAFDADSAVATAAIAKSSTIANEIADSTRLAPASIIMPALVRAVQIERTTRTLRSGLRVVLAVELFRAEQGKLPESIDDLAEILGKEQPIDWEDPARLPPRYLKRDEARGYVVYSVGRDGTDDRGTRDAANPFGEPSKKAAADYILNWVEPPASK